MGNVVTPYEDRERSKKEQVTEMFDNIAPKYDFLNHLLSAGIDIRWRRKAIRMLQPYAPKVVLDIATGTGDFAVEALKLNPEKVIGLDISAGMLEVGRQKMVRKKVDVAIGGDQGGSIRIPASWCGIVGLKPTYGLVPYTGIMPIEMTYDHVGPMARTVEDCATLLEVSILKNIVNKKS